MNSNDFGVKLDRLAKAESWDGYLMLNKKGDLITVNCLHYAFEKLKDIFIKNGSVDNDKIAIAVKNLIIDNKSIITQQSYAKVALLAEKVGIRPLSAEVERDLKEIVNIFSLEFFQKKEESHTNIEEQKNDNSTNFIQKNENQPTENQHLNNINEDTQLDVEITEINDEASIEHFSDLNNTASPPAEEVRDLINELNTSAPSIPIPVTENASIHQTAEFSETVDKPPSEIANLNEVSTTVVPLSKKTVSATPIVLKDNDLSEDRWGVRKVSLFCAGIITMIGLGFLFSYSRNSYWLKTCSSLDDYKNLGPSDQTFCLTTVLETASRDNQPLLKKLIENSNLDDENIKTAVNSLKHSRYSEPDSESKALELNFLNELIKQYPEKDSIILSILFEKSEQFNVVDQIIQVIENSKEDKKTSKVFSQFATEIIASNDLIRIENSLKPLFQKLLDKDLYIQEIADLTLAQPLRKRQYKSPFSDTIKVLVQKKSFVPIFFKISRIDALSFPPDQISFYLKSVYSELLNEDTYLNEIIDLAINGCIHGGNGYSRMEYFYFINDVLIKEKKFDKNKIPELESAIQRELFRASNPSKAAYDPREYHKNYLNNLKDIIKDFKSAS